MNGVLFRTYTPDDWRFLVHTWHSSWLAGRTYPLRAVPYERLVQGNGLARTMLAIVRRSVVRIAHLEGDPSIILGFIIGEQLTDESAPRAGLIHYVYVKRTARRQGVGRALCDDLIARVGSIAYHSHETYTWQRLGWCQSRFSPGHAFYPLAQEIDLADFDPAASQEG